MLKTNRIKFISEFIYGKPENIDSERGVIHGVTVVQAGIAEGHGIHLDNEFIAAAVAMGNGTNSKGLKARFGHPTMSSTALGTFLGRFKNFRVENNAAKADLYLSKSAKDSPAGNLYDYVLGLSEESPDMFGTSIVFTPGKTYQYNKDGEKVFNKEDFIEGGKDFVELESLHAADLVDDPAAAPNGLFDSVTWAGQVSEFLDTHPHIYKLVADNPEIVNKFMARYNTYLDRKITPEGEKKSESEDSVIDSNFEFLEKENDMPDENETKVNDMERFAALKEAFSDRMDFVVAQFEKGNDVNSAKVELAEIVSAENVALKAENVKLAEENTELKTAKENTVNLSADAEGGDAIEFTANESTEKDFMELSKELQKAEGLEKLGDAMGIVSKKYPEVYAKYINGGK